jgi:hypothetical protein
VDGNGLGLSEKNALKRSCIGFVAFQRECLRGWVSLCERVVECVGGEGGVVVVRWDFHRVWRGC